MARTDESSGFGVTEHTFSKALPGDVESIRQQLVYALEKFGYHILSEQPIQAKRNGQLSFNILKCPLKLTIALKQISATTTLVTFDYSIMISMTTKGDLRTVGKEAEAIIALAAMQQATSICAGCGATNTGDARFCRACGMPHTSTEPAEIEVMRLMSGARAGHQTIITGVIIMLSVLAIAIPSLFLDKPEETKGAWVFLIVGQIVSWLILLYGMTRLHRTLNPKNASEQAAAPRVLLKISGAEAAALPPPQTTWAGSVTEGTTELIGAKRKEAAPASVSSKSADTDAMS